MADIMGVAAYGGCHKTSHGTTIAEI